MLDFQHRGARFVVNPIPLKRIGKAQTVRWRQSGRRPAIDSPSIHSDNDSGFTATTVREWLKKWVSRGFLWGEANVWSDRVQRRGRAPDRGGVSHH
jgi:transposase InsO family protein